MKATVLRSLNTRICGALGLKLDDALEGKEIEIAAEDAERLLKDDNPPIEIANGGKDVEGVPPHSKAPVQHSRHAKTEEPK
jgi:hypothetical protein